MLRNTNMISKSMVQPAYIIFKDLIRVSMAYPTDELKKQFSFPLTCFPDDTRTIKYDELYSLFIRYNKPTSQLELFQKTTDNYARLITESLNKYPADIQQSLSNELVTRTYLDYRAELWNITNAVSVRGLDSADVIGALVKNAEPYGMGVFSNVKQTSNHADLVSAFRAKLTSFISAPKTSMRDNAYMYIDYWNGIGIKSRFPVDITNPATPCKINIRRYNDRNGHSGFDRIIALLAENKCLPDIELLAIIPADKQQDNAEQNRWQDVEYLEGQIKKANEQTIINKPDKSSDNYYIWSYAIEGRVTNYYNHRRRESYVGELATDKAVSIKWPYMMTELRKDYLAESGSYEFELCTLFDFADNTLECNLDRHYFKTASIVNMIIYGRTNINYKCLELLLPLIRIKWDAKIETHQLDNYVVKDEFKYGNEPGPIYKITWRDDNINGLTFADSYGDRVIIVKYLIRLMNEVDPTQLNFNNYYHICSWYHMNDLRFKLLDSMRQIDIDSRSAELELLSCFARLE